MANGDGAGHDDSGMPERDDAPEQEEVVVMGIGEMAAECDASQRRVEQLKRGIHEYSQHANRLGREGARVEALGLWVLAQTLSPEGRGLGVAMVAELRNFTTPGAKFVWDEDALEFDGFELIEGMWRMKRDAFAHHPLRPRFPAAEADDSSGSDA